VRPSGENDGCPERRQRGEFAWLIAARGHHKQVRRAEQAERVHQVAVFRA
jgi:hypothetical protein